MVFVVVVVTASAETKLTTFIPNASISMMCLSTRLVKNKYEINAGFATVKPAAVVNNAWLIPVAINVLGSAEVAVTDAIESKA